MYFFFHHDFELIPAFAILVGMILIVVNLRLSPWMFFLFFGMGCMFLARLLRLQLVFFPPLRPEEKGLTFYFSELISSVAWILIVVGMGTVFYHLRRKGNALTKTDT